MPPWLEPHFAMFKSALYALGFGGHRLAHCSRPFALIFSAPGSNHELPVGQISKFQVEGLTLGVVF